MADELQELVDDPAERLLVEYKSWFDLNDNKHRAHLARHIAALSNSGGGHIIFGFNDDMTPAGPAPAGFNLDTDAVSSITKKYLDPSVQCLVRNVLSTTGTAHPTVIVPGHEATPICAKANGPELEKKIVGITAGVYYLRKPGPESAPIVSPAEWRDVIRRCALHDRAAILTALSGVLTGVEPTKAPEAIEKLNVFAAAADAKYVKDAPTDVFPLRECRLQLSYVIEASPDDVRPPSSLVRELEQIGFEVDRFVKSGWSLFHVFHVQPLAPHWASDPANDQSEFLEATYFEPKRSIGVDLWRIAPGGMATNIREFWEDSPMSTGEPRTYLNPLSTVSMLGELVRHAQAFASRFETATHVTFRCEWRGLAGRVFYTNRGIPSFDPPAVSDHVVTSTRSPVGELGTKTAAIVAALGGRLGRALNWTGLDEQWVKGQEESWKLLN